MIYQCRECEKLYDEDDGYMAATGVVSLFALGGDSMAFVCKNCMSEQGRKKLEEIKNAKKNKYKR